MGTHIGSGVVTGSSSSMARTAKRLVGLEVGLEVGLKVVMLFRIAWILIGVVRNIQRPCGFNFFAPLNDATYLL